MARNGIQPSGENLMQNTHCQSQQSMYGTSDETTVNTIFVAPFYPFILFSFIFFFQKNIRPTRVRVKCISTRQKKNGYYFLSPSDRYKLFMHFGISLPDKRKMGEVQNGRRTAFRSLQNCFSAVSAWRNRLCVCFALFLLSPLISKQDFTVMPTIRL